MFILTDHSVICRITPRNPVEEVLFVDGKPEGRAEQHIAMLRGMSPAIIEDVVYGNGEISIPETFKSTMPIVWTVTQEKNDVLLEARVKDNSNKVWQTFHLDLGNRLRVVKSEAFNLNTARLDAWQCQLRRHHGGFGSSRPCNRGNTRCPACMRAI